MTAVEFLLIKTSKHCFNKQEIEQAKEMEKQQIEDAWNDGNNRYSGIGDSDTYYETLKNK